MSVCSISNRVLYLISFIFISIWRTILLYSSYSERFYFRLNFDLSLKINFLREFTWNSLQIDHNYSQMWLFFVGNAQKCRQHTHQQHCSFIHMSDFRLTFIQMCACVCVRIKDGQNNNALICMSFMIIYICVKFYRQIITQ